MRIIEITSFFIFLQV